MVPLGRGNVRGQRQIDTIEHFRAPRPESSLGLKGKQGILHYIRENS